MTDKFKGQLTFENFVRAVVIGIAIWVGTTSHASAKSVAVLNSQVSAIVKRIEKTPTEREVELMIEVAVLRGKADGT